MGALKWYNKQFSKIKVATDSGADWIAWSNKFFSYGHFSSSTTGRRLPISKAIPLWTGKAVSLTYWFNNKALNSDLSFA